MIINSLRAENVLKYSTLRLEDIPEKGLIAVIGDNESGKSSIGETICFALFGRTFSLESADLDKVIRWGESRCSVKLEFTTPNGQRYQVARFLDELGSHGASISRVGEDPMVRGLEEVEARLKTLIGFGYTEFVESFYLAQREITAPHPHSFAVKAMAGVDALEKVVATCESELEQTGERVEETERRRADIEEQIEVLGLDEGHLASLEAEHAREGMALVGDRQRISDMKAETEGSERVLGTLKQGAAGWLAVPIEASFARRRQQAQELERLVADLEPQCAGDKRTLGPHGEIAALARESEQRIAAFDALRQRADAYRHWLESLLGDAEPAGGESTESTFAARQKALLERQTQVMSARRTSRVLMLASLVLALVFWGLSGLLGLAPTSGPAEALAGWVEGLDTGWEDLLLPSLAVAASAMTLSFLGFVVRGKRLGKQVRELEDAHGHLVDEEEAARREATDLAGLERMPLPHATEMLARLRDDAIAKRIPDYRAGPGAALLDPQRHAAVQAELKRIAGTLETGMTRIKADTGVEIERRHESVATHSSAIARLDQAISQERERVRRHQELTGISGALAEKLDGLRRRVRVRELAVDLLHGAIHYISQRFNTEVRNLSADSLPKFTNGRYEHLRIDENLKVNAFSNEKRDFMELDEISSGTQRQIMLAVRLALSQKLVNSVIQGPQALFLDEPFAFFDERRTASALKVLPRVSGDFTQIWVTSQTFPEESHFDLYVECDAQETRSPVVRRGTAPA